MTMSVSIKSLFRHHNVDQATREQVKMIGERFEHIADWITGTSGMNEMCKQEAIRRLKEASMWTVMALVYSSKIAP